LDPTDHRTFLQSAAPPSREIVENLIKRNRIITAVDNRFDPAVIRVEMKDSNGGPFVLCFLNESKYCPDVVHLSRVGFNSDRTEAVVALIEEGFGYRPTFREWEFLLFHRVDNDWRLAPMTPQ
jgi:hypothetical protein